MAKADKSTLRAIRKANGQCRDCSNDAIHTLCDQCRMKSNLRSKLYAHKVKMLAVSKLGGRCVCCGIDNLDILSIDHVNNNGAQHRNKLKYGGLSVYNSILRGHTEYALQIMCLNCNLSKLVCGDRCEHVGGSRPPPATRQATYRSKTKAMVYGKYGSACVNCGITNDTMLVIDHVNNGGNKHRKEIGPNIYTWIKINNYPDSVQVLCQNCNFIKHLRIIRGHDVKSV